MKVLVGLCDMINEVMHYIHWVSK